MLILCFIYLSIRADFNFFLSDQNFQWELIAENYRIVSYFYFWGGESNLFPNYFHKLCHYRSRPPFKIYFSLWHYSSSSDQFNVIPFFLLHNYKIRPTYTYNFQSKQFSNFEIEKVVRIKKND